MDREDRSKFPSAKKERLAAQLRANLQRRKEQARARRLADQPDDDAEQAGDTDPQKA